MRYLFIQLLPPFLVPFSGHKPSLALRYPLILFLDYYKEPVPMVRYPWSRYTIIFHILSNVCNNGISVQLVCIAILHRLTHTFKNVCLKSPGWDRSGLCRFFKGLGHGLSHGWTQIPDHQCLGLYLWKNIVTSLTLSKGSLAFAHHHRGIPYHQFTNFIASFFFFEFSCFMNMSLKCVEDIVVFVAKWNLNLYVFLIIFWIVVP